jgi:NADH-quinone oxidoreductase subunit E
MDKVEDTLKIKAGETTQDLKFTLERVNCLGCCALGPVVVVDKEYYGKLTPAKVNNVFESYD